jgi:hypothetical protein
MSPQGEKKTGGAADKKVIVPPWLLAIWTAAVLGCFGFAWSTNANIVLLLDHDKTRGNDISDLRVDMNKVKLDMSEVKGRLNTVEQRQNLFQINQSGK